MKGSKLAGEDLHWGVLNLLTGIVNLYIVYNVYEYLCTLLTLQFPQSTTWGLRELSLQSDNCIAGKSKKCVAKFQVDSMSRN